jgi:serine phosphatase RsbU (regulator of sigma subunit)
MRRHARVGLIAAALAVALGLAGLADAYGLELPAVTVSVPSTTVGSVTTPPVTATTPPVTVSPPGSGAVTTPVPAPVPTPVPPPTGVPPVPPVTRGPPSPAELLAGGSARTASSSPSTSPPSSGATATPGRPAPAAVRRSGERSKAGPGHGTGSTPAGRNTGPAGGLPASGPLSPAPATPIATGRRTAARHGQSNPLSALGSNIPLPLPVPDWSKPIIAALVLLAIGLGVRARLARIRAGRLESQRSSLLRDVGFMQAALVPEIPARLGGLAVSVAYRPAEGPAAGGDFYDVFAPSPGKVAVILGDVAGHGHDALRQAALIRYTLRAYIQAGLEPRTALALAGRALERPRGENFATVAVAIYDRRGSRLTYSLAGHPPPLFHGFRAPEPLTICSSPPVGWTMPTGRRQTTLTLPAGSEVCFFSDGLIEARTEEGLLGRERLEQILSELDARDRAPALLEGVRAAATETRDDMAACIFSPESASSSEQVRVEELEVGTREIASGDVQRFIAACRVPRTAMVRTIGHAFDIAAASGSVLLRVEITPTGATVTAAAPPTAALVPLAAPERNGVPIATPVPRSGALPDPATLPLSPAPPRDVAVPNGASERRQRTPRSTEPLRRASDREPSTAGSAVPEPL